MDRPAYSSPSQLGALIDGFRFLARRPRWTFGLMILGMFLGQLGPALELAAKAGSEPVTQMFLSWAALLPMEFYFVPRWMARLDADLIDAPANPQAGWSELFDRRWLPAFGARMAVQIVGGLGLLLLIIPGVVLLTLTGFAPMRVLLRGDAFTDALRWSLRAMARHWPRVAQAALTILIALFTLSILISLGEARVFSQFGVNGPDAWTRLRHPAAWGFQLLQSAILLWVSAAFLGLYQRLERVAAEPEAVQSK